MFPVFVEMLFPFSLTCKLESFSEPTGGSLHRPHHIDSRAEHLNPNLILFSFPLDSLHQYPFHCGLFPSSSSVLLFLFSLTLYSSAPLLCLAEVLVLDEFWGGIFTMALLTVRGASAAVQANTCLRGIRAPVAQPVSHTHITRIFFSFLPYFRNFSASGF